MAGAGRDLRHHSPRVLLHTQGLRPEGQGCPTVVTEWPLQSGKQKALDPRTHTEREFSFSVLL